MIVEQVEVKNQVLTIVGMVMVVVEAFYQFLPPM